MPISDEKMLERRRAMLASARRHLVQAGFEKSTILTLAEAAGITSPTLYNAFGTREAMLFEAVAEDVNRLLDESEASEARGLDRIINFFGSVGDLLIARPGYADALLRATLAEMPPAAVEIGRKMQLDVMAVFSRGIEEMRAAGEVEEWMETAPLALRLNTMHRGVRDDWSAGITPSAQLVDASVFTTALLLLGVTRGAARERCLAIIRELQGSLAAPLPD